MPMTWIEVYRSFSIGFWSLGPDLATELVHHVRLFRKVRLKMIKTLF